MKRQRAGTRSAAATAGGIALVSAVASCGGRTLDFDDGPSNAVGSSGTAGLGSGGTHASGGNTGSGATGGAPPVDLPPRDRRLDELSDEELGKLCREEIRRTDQCMRVGLRSQKIDQAGCEAIVAECRANFPPEDAVMRCEHVREIDCSVTVEQYFACIDAWNQTQTCENAGFVLIERPEPCEAVVECPDFVNEFYRFGRPARCENPVERPADNGDDVYGLDGCYPIPARLIALGNSVARCESAERDGYGCAAQMLAAHLKTTIAPELEYQMLAANGGNFADLPRQIGAVVSGPGHIAVWIYALPEDVKGTPQYDLWREQLGELLDHFTNRAKFPDGATFMINTQYSPSDQCPEGQKSWGPLTTEQEEVLLTLNRRLYIGIAEDRADTVTVDQHPDWLGHGWNGGIKGCPHCYTDNTLWQSDPVHPNELGHIQIFNKWRVAVDRMYAKPCE
jgi:hypothetical protein